MSLTITEYKDLTWTLGSVTIVIPTTIYKLGNVVTMTLSPTEVIRNSTTTSQSLKSSVLPDDYYAFGSGGDKALPDMFTRPILVSIDNILTPWLINYNNTNKTFTIGPPNPSSGLISLVPNNVTFKLVGYNTSWHYTAPPAPSQGTGAGDCCLQ